MTKSQEWIVENFEYLVAGYRGKYIGVIDEEIVSTRLTPREVLEDVKRMGRQEEEISLLKVPTEEELICLL